jgi:hypothetical protein
MGMGRGAVSIRATCAGDGSRVTPTQIAMTIAAAAIGTNQRTDPIHDGVCRTSGAVRAIAASIA